MKFERLLKIYWARFFLFGGRTSSFELTLLQLVHQSAGLGKHTFDDFCQRFEWLDKYTHVYKKTIEAPLDKRLDKASLRIINRYLAHLSSINHPLSDLTMLNVLRLYLIRTFRGRAYVLHKPSHGQRTRSNANSAKTHNSLLNHCLQEYRKHLQIQLKSLRKETFYRKKKGPIKPPKVKLKRMIKTPLSSPHIKKWF